VHIQHRYFGIELVGNLDGLFQREQGAFLEIGWAQDVGEHDRPPLVYGFCDGNEGNSVECIEKVPAISSRFRAIFLFRSCCTALAGCRSGLLADKLKKAWRKIHGISQGHDETARALHFFTY